MALQMLEYPKHGGLPCVSGLLLFGPAPEPQLQLIEWSKHDYRPNMFWLFLSIVSAAFDGRADSRIPRTRRHVICFFGLPQVGQALEPKQQTSKNKNGLNSIIGQICVGRFCFFSAVFDGGADAWMLKTHRPAICFGALLLSQEPDPKRQMSETTTKQKYLYYSCTMRALI